jgi:AraC-like DNA-binding protein
VEANGTDPGFGQPDLSQRTKFLVSQVATPHSSFEYSCQAKVHLIDFRAAASGEIKGNMQTIAFYVTSDSTPAAHVGSGENLGASPKRRFGVAMPGEKVNAKWLQRNAVDVTALLFEPNEALDTLIQCGNAITAQTALIENFAVSTILAIKENLALDGYFGRLFAESATLSLLHHVRARCGYANDRLARREAGGIAAAIDLIHARFRAALTLSEIAATSRLSLPRFIQSFKQHTGLTPHQYVLRLRVERARELLARNDLGLGLIALESGFYDQSRLTTVFKRVMGLTPGQFRKSLL